MDEEDSGRRRQRGSEEDEETDRRKRQPPSNVVRTQYGNPVQHAFGNARNASDVLMLAAAEAARKPKPAVSANTTPGCRVCATVLQPGMFNNCKRCRRATCINCIRSCQRCRSNFCSYCSTNNYKQDETRVFCIDCDLLE